ncbi:MAG: DUF4367 domain-containing protein [Christensenellales bacterium]
MNDETCSIPSKEMILSALNDEEIAKTISDEAIDIVLEQEFKKGDYDIDVQTVEACLQILWDRHAYMTEKQLEKSKRRSLRKFRRSIRTSNIKHTINRFYNHFSLKPIATVLIICAVAAIPLISLKPNYIISLSPDEEQYIVSGVQQNSIGAAKADIDDDFSQMNIKLNSVDEISTLLGYDVPLPSFIPEECVLDEISVDKTSVLDSVFVAYAKGNDKSISISIEKFYSRVGYKSYYEQEKKGRIVMLENGKKIYTADNINSVWGIYHTPNIDYSIDAMGFDEDTLLKIFNSIEGKNYE